MKVPPELAEEFEYRGELGRGAQGVVLRVVQRSLGREVALKLLPCHDAEHQARFEREARLLSRLDHPALVRIYTYGVAGEWLYHACALHPGEPLEERLKREGPMHWAKAARIGASVADGLVELHQLGVIHRDVKPSNILLTLNDRPVLLDLGVSYDARDERLTSNGWFVGTPACAAPEQIQGEGILPAADLYSLGVTLVMMVTGVNPFSGETATMTMQNHLTLDPRPFLDEKLPGVPEDLVLLLSQLLRKEPELRPASAGVVRDRLEQIGGGREGISSTGPDSSFIPLWSDPVPVRPAGTTPAAGAAPPLSAASVAGSAPGGVSNSTSGITTTLRVTSITTVFFVATFACGILIGLRPWKSEPPAVPPPSVRAPPPDFAATAFEQDIRREEDRLETLRARRVRGYQHFASVQPDTARDLVESAIREGIESLEAVEGSLRRLPTGVEAAPYRATLEGLRYRQWGQLIACITFSRGEILGGLASPGLELTGLTPAMKARIPSAQDARHFAQFRSYVDALRQAFPAAIRSPLNPEVLGWHLEGLHDSARIVATYPWERSLDEPRDQFVGLLERSIPQWGEEMAPGGPIFSSLFLLVWNWGKRGGGEKARAEYAVSIRHHAAILENAYPTDGPALAELMDRCARLGSTDITSP